MNKIELYNSLPISWEQVTLNKYIQYRQLIDDLGGKDNIEGIYKNIIAIYFFVFTGVNLQDAEVTDVELFDIANKMNMFENNEDNLTVTIDNNLVKNIDEIAFEDLMTFIKLQESNSIANYPTMINLLLKEPIEDIGNEMNMATAYSFFCSYSNS
ncbi:hypothetical protein [Sphingobacterium sp. IITKGP-BTPF85]|uniref:hypothetical protein n=1 Tax=Sphingobacterium sp. IITKGP-BTPF85 TaxID=1338009 RepID=UPI00038A16CA|nr:hypothetical protein [Sphingobacterium sp. IITKGP-BTPF85]KKX48347.1 hypothetical protein L950_0221585 [Sphingobacterium sp. IITKGP-BTPF85]